MLQLCGVLELVWWHSGRARLRPRRRSPCRQPAATNTGAAQWDSQMVATLYCTVLYCSVLYCTVLYCTVQYCTLYFSTFDYNAWQKMVADSLVTMKWPRWPSFESERRVATEEIYDLSYTAGEAQTLLPPLTRCSCLHCDHYQLSPVFHTISVRSTWRGDHQPWSCIPSNYSGSKYIYLKNICLFAKNIFAALT